MEFSRQEYWSGLPFPSTGDLPNPGIKTWSPALQADSLSFVLLGKPPMDMSLSKLQEIVKDRKAWYAVIRGVTKSQTSPSDQTTICFNSTGSILIKPITGCK